MSLNKVTLIGHVGQDPETKKLTNGTTVTSFSLATSESYKKDGNRVTNTEWHRITLFGPQADIADKYLKKGSKIYLEGKIKTESWEKDGVKQFATKIVGNTFLMLDGKRDENTVPSGESYTDEKNQMEPDDLPF